MRQSVRTFITRSCRAVDITSTKVGGEGEQVYLQTKYICKDRAATLW
jgi:hypothetical protein